MSTQTLLSRTLIRFLEHSALPYAGGWLKIFGKVLATARENLHTQSEVALGSSLFADLKISSAIPQSTLDDSSADR